MFWCCIVTKMSMLPENSNPSDQESPQEEADELPEEGFDEEPDTVDLTPDDSWDREAIALSGPGDEDDDNDADQGFEEEADTVERGDDEDFERR